MEGQDGHKVQCGSYFKASGNNYLAEAAAILAALMNTPAQAHLDIWTDAKSLLDAIVRGPGSERDRIRAAGRPVITSIRRVLKARQSAGGTHRLRHVRSHTGGDSPQEIGNDEADRRANVERILARDQDGGKPFLFNEEMFIAEMKE